MQKPPRLVGGGSERRGSYRRIPSCCPEAVLSLSSPFPVQSLSVSCSPYPGVVPVPVRVPVSIPKGTYRSVRHAKRKRPQRKFRDGRSRRHLRGVSTGRCPRYAGRTVDCQNREMRMEAGLCGRLPELGHACESWCIPLTFDALSVSRCRASAVDCQNRCS